MDSPEYMEAIADARYVIRRAFRLADEQARNHGIEPLYFQALLQLAGAESQELAVTQLAERMDVARPLASRMAMDLEERGLVNRFRSNADRRVTVVELAEDGAELVRQVDADVKRRFEWFQREIPAGRRRNALRVFASNLGVEFSDDIDSSP